MRRKEKHIKGNQLPTLPQDVLMQVAQYSTAKEVWDSIKVKHLGADLVQKARLQTLRSELETLKIKPNEKVSDFGGKLSSIMAKFKGLGETLEDKVLVRKLLNSVPKKFLLIVATIEQYQDLDEMSFEEAVGRLTAYEERIKSQDTLEANDQDKLLMASSNNKRASKHIQTHIGSHQDQTSSKSGDLPLGALEAELFKDVKPDIHKLTKKSNVCKTASFTSSTTENNPKVHHSVESPSSGLSKRTRRKINYRNTKPTTISSGTSPASHFHVAISESDFQSPPHPPCHNFGERKFKKQCSTRFSIGNITPSGLRMPSPRIGFFDEEQPLQLNNKESMQIFNEFQYLERRLSFLNKVYGMVPSSLVQ
ncbi:hypothetical protein Tco_0663075, partial [Tanacetum coccineum]